MKSRIVLGVFALILLVGLAVDMFVIFPGRVTGSVAETYATMSPSTRRNALMVGIIWAGVATLTAGYQIVRLGSPTRWFLDGRFSVWRTVRGALIVVAVTCIGCVLPSEVVNSAFRVTEDSLAPNLWVERFAVYSAGGWAFLAALIMSCVSTVARLHLWATKKLPTSES
jgi:hypothetical protein